MMLNEEQSKRAIDVCTSLVQGIGDLHGEIRRLRVGDGLTLYERAIGSALSLRAVEDVLSPAMARLEEAQHAGPEAITIKHIAQLDRATQRVTTFVKKLRAIGQVTDGYC